jgi:hypothetical protein
MAAALSRQRSKRSFALRKLRDELALLTRPKVFGFCADQFGWLRGIRNSHG